MPRYWDLTQDTWDDDIDLLSPVRRKIDIISPPSENVTKTKRRGRTAVPKAKPFRKEKIIAGKRASSASPESEVDSGMSDAAYGGLASEKIVDSYQTFTPATRSQSGAKIKVANTGAPLPATAIEECMSTLAGELQGLESSADLKLLYPPQCSTTWRPKKVHSREEEVLNEFIMMEDHKAASEEKEFLEFDLHEFCVYRARAHPNGFEGQFESLMTVASEKDKLHWLVDGVIEHKGIQRRVMGAQIINVSIGGFEDLKEHGTEIWIMTLQSRSRHYWYRLGNPTKSYSNYWTDFVWLAEFSKHFIDYLFDNPASDLCLNDFEAKFWTWLQTLHGNHINKWHAQCGFQTDFCKHVTHFAQFLRNQAYSLYEQDPTKLSHPIWDEIGVGTLTYDKQASSTHEKTIVTANVAHTFLKTFPHWHTEHDLLEVVQPCPEVDTYRRDRLISWDFPDKFAQAQRHHFWGEEQLPMVAQILENAVSDGPIRVRLINELLRKVVIIRIKSTSRQDELRYAWVRSVSRSLKAVNVVWLIVPNETICSTIEGLDQGTFYPIGNELFFTDDCNCNEVMVKDIVKVIDASVFRDHAQGKAQIFVQCLYRKHEQIFVNAVEENLTCRCRGSKTVPCTKKKQQATPTSQATQQTRPKLQVLSLFSGCGLLDYAFCAPGDHAQTDLAIEHCEVAVRSYQANDPQKRTRCVVGSVNEQLLKYLRGDEPMRQFHCIIAGCPCQGFSSLNTFKRNRQGQKNCSMLAHTLSWVETFMPAYVIIENVPKMDEARPNACAQAICLLVALGYQVRKMLCTAASLGGASNRQRLIIIAAAPSVVLPNDIPKTNGKGYSRPVRTSSQAIGDLPDLDNDTIINVRNPNHIPLHRLRVDIREGVNYRSLVQQIPRGPSEMSLRNTYYAGGLLFSQRTWFESLDDFKHRKDSKCLTRIDPDNPFRTICTIIAPMDAMFSGVIIHPFQDRILSLEEARRGMDLPNRFRLVGSISQQFKMLGNGVPWSIGAAIGRAVGKSWAASWERHANRVAQHVGMKETKSEWTTGTFDGVYLSADVKRAKPVIVAADDAAGASFSAKLKRARPVVLGDDTESGSSAQSKRSRRVITDSDDDDDSGSSVPLKQTRPMVLHDGDDDAQSDTSVEFIEERRAKKRPQ
ncbi:hypothetical protein LTR10_014541 [Elasticomyces elasticus]|uniref:DNA (cytosine-5-)-methyltransferase n=1 Tax=Exophiala sideris TaxID=1016849 RepID=A0ABR0JSD2_9EURO|nr:hypothetical protein LTR10_014541 [Elasticomyces elasticus]KAK5040520.1 hypothetical protein LTS07_001018 [Exophiala sideris]KAK5043055.1 hypothetical protein LTR13_000826 [Exophiala sideris]KAK5068898.1 hypothetical protein LTR69_001019 [Exophiala sideris]KAK5186494.1 hypothetical protein LTR44_001550 [Eurotiomycetes sp. CCFEE 6388]